MSTPTGGPAFPVASSGGSRLNEGMSLYGYFRNPFIHESAAALVSLHATKAGAWRAMRAGLFAAAVEEREFSLRTGRRGWFNDNLLADQAYFIQPVTVLP